MVQTRWIAAILIFLLFVCPIAALVPVSSGNTGELEAEITVENKSLLQQSEKITVSAVVSNPSDTPYNLSLMRYEDETLMPVQAIGAVPSHSKTTVVLGITVTYPEKSGRITKYALLAEQDGKLMAKGFTVEEDWTPYENSVKASLVQTNIFFIPLIGLVLIGILFFISEVASRTPVAVFGKEFTLRTLFFPHLKGAPLGEEIADLFTDPFFWIAEILCVLWLASVIHSTVVANLGTEVGTMVFVISGIGALTLPLCYFLIMWYTKREPARFPAALFVYGMFTAFLSFLFSSTWGPSAGKLLAAVTGAPAAMMSTIFISPLIEELAKSLGILVVSWHKLFNDTTAGLLFGFMVGIGFSFIENWFYFASKTTPFELGFLPWVALILYRSSFNSIAHGCFGGACGAIVGYVKSHREKFHSIGLIPGLFIAVSLHIIFNFSAILDGFMVSEQKIPFFIFNPALVAVLFVLLVLTFLLVSKKESQKKRGESAFFPA